MAVAPNSPETAVETTAEPLASAVEPSAASEASEAWSMVMSSEGIVRLVGLVAAEVVGVIVLAVALYLLVAGLLKRFETATKSEGLAEKIAAVRTRIRGALIAVSAIGILALLSLDTWLLYQGEDALSWTLTRIREVPREAWIALGLGIGQVIVAAIGAGIFNRTQRRVLATIEAKINAWDKAEGNDQSLKAFCTSLSNVLANTAWLLVLWFAVTRLPLPESFEGILLRGITIYLTIAVGLLAVRITAVVVDTADALSHRMVEDKSWYDYYAHLRRLVPLLRRCVEYALWIGVATLVLYQLEAVDRMADFGPRLIQAIGIFFIGRGVIELGFLLIENGMAAKPEMEEGERRRRDTIKPLVKTVFRFASLFVIFVLMLTALGFNPLPLLAGAGILGMVIGLGAQPLINDVMSGFFILFENLYLRGDFIQAGEARGTVESIDFRTTRIRDIEGNLRILRNGDLREIINYSKDFTSSVVDVTVPYEVDVRQVFAELEAAGGLLREQNADVTADIEVRGITEFDDDGLRVRTVTRVKPGCHASVAAALRLLIKDRFDAAGIAIAGDRLAVTVVGREAAPGG